MQVSLPKNFSDLIVYDQNGDILTFKNQEELNKKLQKCNIQPIIKIDGFEMDEDNNLQPITVIESIRIISYIGE